MIAQPEHLPLGVVEVPESEADRACGRAIELQQFGTDDVLTTPSSLFSAADLTFASERALGVALQLFRKGSADFADCVHVALATQAGEHPLWTFDKGAAKASGARLLAKT